MTKAWEAAMPKNLAEVSQKRSSLSEALLAAIRASYLGINSVQVVRRAVRYRCISFVMEAR